MKRDPRLVFYEGEELENFIESYPLDEEERRFLYKVARHVRRGKVEEELLEEADVLVRTIRKEREPIQPIPKRVRREPQADYSSFEVLQRLRTRSTYLLWSLMYFLPLTGLLSYHFFSAESPQRTSLLVPEKKPSEHGDRSDGAEWRKGEAEKKRKEKKVTKALKRNTDSRVLPTHHHRDASPENPHRKMSRIPFSNLGIERLQREKKQVCIWEEGRHHYIYEPLEENIREKEDCERVLKGWENWEIRAWKPAKRDGMKLKGTL